MSTERRFFRNTVRQYEHRLARDPEMPSDMDTMIQFTHSKVTANRWLEAPEPIVYGGRNVISRAKSFVLLSDVKRFSERPRYVEFMAEKLSGIRVPEDEQAAVIEKIFRVVQVAIPEHAILVCVLDVTLRFLDSASNLGPGGLTAFLWRPRETILDDDRMNMDRDPMEPIEAYEPKLIPATKSFIEGLEKVRFDSLETSIRQMPCPICWEGLDHFAVEQGTDQQLIINRLPCSHLYHGDCIVQWLERNHLCPMCRYAMPTVEVEAGEPSNPSRQRHWDLLMMSAGGILTTAACVGLQIIDRSKVQDENIRLSYICCAIGSHVFFKASVNVSQDWTSSVSGEIKSKLI